MLDWLVGVWRKSRIQQHDPQVLLCAPCAALTSVSVFDLLCICRSSRQPNAGIFVQVFLISARSAFSGEPRTMLRPRLQGFLWLLTCSFTMHFKVLVSYATRKILYATMDSWLSQSGRVPLKPRNLTSELQRAGFLRRPKRARTCKVNPTFAASRKGPDTTDLFGSRRSGILLELVQKKTNRNRQDVFQNKRSSGVIVPRFQTSIFSDNMSVRALWNLSVLHQRTPGPEWPRGG